MYKRKIKKMLSINTNESTRKKLEKSVDWYDKMWKMKIINNQHCEKNSLISFNKYFVSWFSSIKQETHLMSKKLKKMQIKKLL